MYAIVNTGGKQYKVATDDVITVEKIEGNGGRQGHPAGYLPQRW